MEIRKNTLTIFLGTIFFVKNDNVTKYLVKLGAKMRKYDSYFQKLDGFSNLNQLSLPGMLRDVVNYE